MDDDAAADTTFITFDTRAGYHQALHDALQRALAQGSREMWWIDSDFREWPLDAEAWIDALHAWLKLPGRRLTLLANEFDSIQHSHPRFVRWRRDWSHCVAGRKPMVLEPPIVDSVWLCDDGLSVGLHDSSRFRGWSAVGGPVSARWRRQLDAILQRSEEAFPTMVAGV